MEKVHDISERKTSSSSESDDDTSSKQDTAEIGHFVGPSKQKHPFYLCAFTCTVSFISNLINDKARKYYEHRVSTVAFTGYEQGMLFIFALLEYWYVRGFQWPPYSIKTQTALASTGIFRVFSRFLGAQALLTYSLDFVSYTILKCGKILVFLVVSCCFLKIPSLIDVAIGFTLFLSLIIFKLPDGKAALGEKNMLAILCMFASISITIFTTIFQERLMNATDSVEKENKKRKVDSLDLMVHAGVIPIIYLILHILTRGTIDRLVFMVLTIQNFFVYGAARLNLKVIQDHGAFISLITASIRKVLTICSSMIIDKHIAATDFLGLTVFAFCVFLMVLKGRKKEVKYIGVERQDALEMAVIETSDSASSDELP